MDEGPALCRTEEALPEVQETPCLFCPNTVRFIVDFSLSVASPGERRPPGTTSPRASAAAKEYTREIEQPPAVEVAMEPAASAWEMSVTD